VGLPQIARCLEDKLWARAEGRTYRAKKGADVQDVCSGVQHHHHRKDPETGEDVPLLACQVKEKRPPRCKGGFPKVKQLSLKPKVVCPGVAKKHGLRVSGRRNALGSLLGKRFCPWRSGIAPGFAAFFRANTNTSPNFRPPPSAKTHDPECTRPCLDRKRPVEYLAMVTQRAMKQITGYFTGYTSKRQPVGRYELEQSSRTLNFVEENLVVMERDIGGL